MRRSVDGRQARSWCGLARGWPWGRPRLVVRTCTVGTSKRQEKKGEGVYLIETLAEVNRVDVVSLKVAEHDDKVDHEEEERRDGKHREDVDQCFSGHGKNMCRLSSQIVIAIEIRILQFSYLSLFVLLLNATSCLWI